MTEHVNEIALNHRYRLVVDYDTDAPDPRVDRADTMITGACSVAVGSRYVEVTPVHDHPGDVRRAHEQLYQWWPARSHAPSANVRRWSRIFHGIEMIHDDGTYWWADLDKMAEAFPDLVPGTPVYIEAVDGVLAGEMGEYKRWAAGEVCGVTLEKLVDWARLDEHGDFDGERGDSVIQKWEQADGDSVLWGCYLDDDYTALDVAIEHFGLAERGIEVNP